MRIAVRVVGPVLIAGAFAGLTGVTDAAAAPAHQQLAPKAASAATQLTQGFDIRNLSSHLIELTGVTSAGNGDDVPNVGTILRPGESMHYEKVFWFANTPRTGLTFHQYKDGVGGAATVFSVELGIQELVNVPSISMNGDGKVGQIEVQGLGVGSQALSFVDKSGGAPIEVTEQDKQRQADLLNQLCVGGQAACTFTETTSETGPDLVERELQRKNSGETDMNISYKQVLTFSATTSVELSGSASTSLFGLVNATLSGKYGQGWSQISTNEVTTSFTVKPGQTGIIDVHQPTIRQRGDFTVTMGNTKWILRGVHFDIPKGKASAVGGAHWL